MERRWKNADYDTLAEQAEGGRVGQGAVVEATRRLTVAVDRFSCVSTCLAVAMIVLVLVQIAIAVAQAKPALFRNVADRTESIEL